MSLLAAQSPAAEPTVVLHAAQLVELAVLTVAVVVLARRWRDRRSEATGWALAMFALFAAIVAVSFLDVTDDGSLLRHSYTVVLVSVLLLIPYLLVRFTASLGALGRRACRLAAVLTVAQLAATVVSPRFPEPGEPRTTWFTAYVLLVLVGWTAQSAMSAVGLWSAGRGQPSVVRRRMRTLSAGAVVVVIALVSSAGSSAPSTTSQTVTTLIGVLGICLLVLAFVVPSWLRAAWREQDLAALAVAERGLMAAVTPDEVAATIVPALVQLFGARGAALLGSDGRPLLAEGLPDYWLRQLDAELVGAERVVMTDDGAFACRMSKGWLVVRAGSFAPVFGPAELALLERISAFVDLALQRCQLFEQEAQSRRAAEAANAELQTFVYSVSHDLRNPIISVLGYLDVLEQEHAGELTGEGPHYLSRISVNALYMQSLIQDLLELSRIGRSEPPSQAVAVGALAESVAHEVHTQHPGCELSVEGEFPVLWMSDLRARQLLTNLIDNAAKHAQGQARVTVRAVADPGGGATVLIADNGRGVAPAYREKAFEVFERLDAARTQTPGTGMGLPICKRIVESLGGTIALEGPPDWAPTGTTARIQLPADVVRGWSPLLRTTQKENVS
jgi:signal transduction histidine kinase/uncharacterized membrane protein YhaH (DUF805 family)